MQAKWRSAAPPARPRGLPPPGCGGSWLTRVREAADGLRGAGAQRCPDARCMSAVSGASSTVSMNQEQIMHTTLMSALAAERTAELRLAAAERREGRLARLRPRRAARRPRLRVAHA